MSASKFLRVAFVLILLTGCRTIPSKEDIKKQKETNSALKAVAESVTGQTLSDQQLKELDQKIQNDDEAQSAINSVSGAMSGQSAVMYCPVDGKRFSPRQKVCPEHQVPLKEVEP